MSATRDGGKVDRCRADIPIVVASAAIALGCIGCAGVPSNSPRLLVVGWDTHGRNRSQLDAQVAAGVRLIRQLSSDRDHLALYAAGRETAELYDHPPPASRELLLRVLKDGLSAQSTGTSVRPGHFWTVVSRRAAQSSAPTEVVLFTDGADDERRDRRREVVAEAVQRLAANSRVVRVTIAGVRPENRAHVRATFARLGNRLELRGAEELRLLSPAQESAGGPQ